MSKIFQKEQQMILRLPQNIADQVNQVMDDKNTQMQEIELTPLMTQYQDNSKEIQFRFKYGDFSSNASLLRLPCIIESQKTLDQINFFKSNDICDMIYVHPNNEENLEKVQNYDSIAQKKIQLTKPEIRKKKQGNNILSSHVADEKFIRHFAKNGLSAPTKNIKKRYYQQRPLVPQAQLEEVEKDLFTIIKEDLCKSKIDQEENLQESEIKPQKRKYVRRH